MNRPLMIVAGTGAGLGQSLLRRFQEEGYTAMGLVRSLPPNPENLNLHLVDMTDSDTVSALISQLITTYGPPQVVIHNTAELVIQPFADTTLEDFEQCWRSIWIL